MLLRWRVVQHVNYTFLTLFVKHKNNPMVKGHDKSKALLFTNQIQDLSKQGGYFRWLRGQDSPLPKTVEIHNFYSRLAP